jgi:hypothetical protein
MDSRLSEELLPANNAVVLSRCLAGQASGLLSDDLTHGLVAAPQ